MIAPVFVLDAQESWRPVDVDDSLAKYGYKWSAGWRSGDRPVNVLDFPAAMDPGVFAKLPAAGYHRTALGGDLLWHQYWTWWPYNPKKYAGVGAHEGDWELVQLGCIDEAGDRPVMMTCSQHGGGEKREYWRVALEDGQPIVYVARDSHANYFQPTRDVTDTADGKGERLHLRWLDFGAWVKWGGKWGNSVNSPGPLTTRRAWKAPHAYHGQCR